MSDSILPPVFTDPGDRLLTLDPISGRTRGLGKAPEGEPTPVVNLVPKEGPWSGNNQLGYAFAGFPSNADDTQTILKLDEWGFPEVFTLALGIEYSDADATALAGYYHILATISAGIGGAFQKIEMDWQNGAVISLPMNAISVVASIEQPLSNFVVPTAEMLVLSATLSHGSTAAVIGPTRTIQQSVANATTGVVIRIPNFTKSVTLVGGAATAANDAAVFAAGNFVEFLGDPTGINAGSMSCARVPNFSGGVPLPVGAKYIRYVNGSATTITFSWVFHLGI